jgi:hypothetical protein
VRASATAVRTEISLGRIGGAAEPPHETVVARRVAESAAPSAIAAIRARETLVSFVCMWFIRVTPTR